MNGISPPRREGLVSQASEGNEGLAPSGLAQAPQGAGLDLVPTRVGGESSPNRSHPFTTALSQYGSTELFRPVQTEVSPSTTVVEQAQDGLRQGFRWLGEIVHRTIGVGPGEYQIDPLLVPSPLPSRTSPPGHAQSIGSVVGPTTPNQRSLMPPSSWEERATASVEEAAASRRSKQVVQTLRTFRKRCGVRCRTLCPNRHRQCIGFRVRMRR